MPDNDFPARGERLRQTVEDAAFEGARMRRVGRLAVSVNSSVLAGVGPIKTHAAVAVPPAST